MKADKTKEKGSQYDPKHAADKEETPVGGGLQNPEQRFITMVEVVVLLEQERAKRLRRDFMHEGLLIH